MKMLKKTLSIILTLLTIISIMSFSLVSANAGDGNFVIITDEDATPAAGLEEKTYATYDPETGYWEGVVVGKQNATGTTYDNIGFFSVVLYDGQLLKIHCEERPHILMMHCTCGRYSYNYSVVDNISNFKILHTCEYVLHGYYEESGHIKATVDGVELANPVYAIKVTNGRPSSSYAEVGTSVTLEADQIDGKKFSHWVINGATVADVNAKETTFTMPDNEVTAEAIYTDCDCDCHSGNIFTMIKIFIQNLFALNQVCEGCEGVHIKIIVDILTIFLLRY